MIIRIDTDKLPKSFNEFQKLPKSDVAMGIDVLLTSAITLHNTREVYRELVIYRDTDKDEEKKLKRDIAEMTAAISYKIWIKQLEESLTRLGRPQHRKDCTCGECK